MSKWGMSCSNHTEQCKKYLPSSITGLFPKEMEFCTLVMKALMFRQVLWDENPIPAAIPGKPAATWFLCTKRCRQLRTTAGRTHAAFCPTRVKGKGRELKGTCTWQVKEATCKPAHHNNSKGIGAYCRKGMTCKAKRSRASLLHADRTSLPSMPGVPHQASSYQASHMQSLHQAWKTLNWKIWTEQKDQPFIFS